MGTIVERRRKSGATAYMARIIIARNGRKYREAKTFDRRAAAVSWLARREGELSEPGALERDTLATLGDAIDRALADTANMGKTKRQVLTTLRTLPIAALRCDAIGSAEVVALAQDLAGDRGPATVLSYLSHLRGVFALAMPAWRMPLKREVMTEAMVVAKRLRIVGKSRHRSRRPSVEEMNRIMAHFRGRWMADLIAFAMFSTRRQEEITRLAWADLDEPGSRIVVRDMKHPGEKDGNDVVVDLPAEALAIIRRQPRTGPLIFPRSTDAISAAFTRACNLTGIDDLHFHDLRHEGVSRLFEMGLSLPRVAAVSGHRSWPSLKRYTHLRQTGDKWEGWLSA